MTWEGNWLVGRPPSEMETDLMDLARSKGFQVRFNQQATRLPKNPDSSYERSERETFC